MSPVDMGGQFEKILILGQPPGSPFNATGPFDWDDCYIMSIFIFQSLSPGHAAAAAAVGKPVIAPDPSNPGQPMWTLQVKVKLPNPPEITDLLQAGPALAVAAAAIEDRGAVRIEQWGQYIDLQ